MSNIVETHVVLGCVHLPFHNEEFFNAICKYIKDLGPRLTGLHLIGDTLDMHSISRHAKGKITIPGLTLEKEYHLANRALDKLDSAIGKRKIQKNYFWGNHENWYNVELASVDSHKLGRGVIKSPTEACKFIQRGYRVQEDFQDAYIELGDLLLIHGEYINQHSAKKHLDVLKRSVLYAHTHTVQQFDESHLSAYNIGCLIDIDASVFKYASRIHRARWRNAFAVVYVDQNKKSHVNIVRWNGDNFVVDGRIY
jgi:hypothetical protein